MLYTETNIPSVSADAVAADTVSATPFSEDARNVNCAFGKRETETVETSDSTIDRYAIDLDAIAETPGAAGFDACCPAPVWIEESSNQLAEIVGKTGAVADRLRALVALLATLERAFEQGAAAAYLSAAPDAAARAQRGDALARWFRLFNAHFGRVFERRLLPELSQLGIGVRRVAQLEHGQRAWAREQFLHRFYPILTPLAIDSGHPFPYISNGSINLLVELQNPEQAAWQSPPVLYARVKVPRAGLPLLSIPQPGHESSARHRHGTALAAGYDRTGYERAGYGSAAPAFFVWSGDLVRHFVHELFPGMTLRNLYWFRVLRASQDTPFADTFDRFDPAGIAEEGAGHPFVEENLTARYRRHRRLGESAVEPKLRTAARQDATPVIRLEIEDRMPDAVVRWLAGHLRAPQHGIVSTPCPLEMFSLPLLLDALPRLLDGRVPSPTGERVLAPVYS